MCLRISERLAGAGLACLALAACEGGTKSDDGGSRRPLLAEETRAECASGAGAAWSRDCHVDRQGDLLVMRHADGGFRRFHVVRNGQGLVVADGAEPAEIRIIDPKHIEVAVGEDRYRLPAQMASAAP